MYNSWENNRFGDQMWKCQVGRILTRGYTGKKTPFCSLRSSIHVNGDIFKFDIKLWEIRVKWIFKMSSKAHCKVCLFIRMTPRVSFIQYPRLYSVLHMSQINVRLTSLRTGDVALCPDNLRPIKTNIICLLWLPSVEFIQINFLQFKVMRMFKEIWFFLILWFWPEKQMTNEFFILIFPLNQLYHKRFNLICRLVLLRIMVFFIIICLSGLTVSPWTLKCLWNVSV